MPLNYLLEADDKIFNEIVIILSKDSDVRKLYNFIVKNIRD